LEGNASSAVLVVPASLLACCTSVIVALAETAKDGIVIRITARSVSRIAPLKCGQILVRRTACALKTILWRNPFPDMNEIMLTVRPGRVEKD
jgi:hypothetical protein